MFFYPDFIIFINPGTGKGDSLFEFSNYTTRGGVDVPFVIQQEELGIVCIAIDADDGASDKSLNSLTRIKKKFHKAKTVVLHLGKESYLSHAGHLCLPFDCIF